MNRFGKSIASAMVIVALVACDGSAPSARPEERIRSSEGRAMDAGASTSFHEDRATTGSTSGGGGLIDGDYRQDSIEWHLGRSVKETWKTLNSMVKGKQEWEPFVTSQGERALKFNDVEAGSLFGIVNVAPGKSPKHAILSAGPLYPAMKDLLKRAYPKLKVEESLTFK